MPLLFLLLLFNTSFAFASILEDEIVRADKVYKSREAHDKKCYPIGIATLSPDSPTKEAREAYFDLPEGRRPSIFFDLKCTDVELIKSVQSDYLGALNDVRNKMAKEKNLKLCDNPSSFEYLASKNGYLLDYTFYSPEGWRLIYFTISPEDCNR